MVRLDVALQILRGFKLHAALGTPQPSGSLLPLRVSGRDRSSQAGTLAVCSPDFNNKQISGVFLGGDVTKLVVNSNPAHLNLTKVER